MSGYETALRREQVYHRLRRDILDCALPPGARLHEPELAERFSISKSPVRDALLRLEAEKLVIVRPRKAYQVAPLSVSDAREFFELRTVLEQACVLNAARNAADSSLRALDRFRTTHSNGNAGDFIAYNREFHLGITKLCDNRRLAGTAADLIEQFDRFVIVSVQRLPAADPEVLIAEHCHIIDALQARAARKAAALLSSHIRSARRRVLSALSRNAAAE